MTSRGFSGHLMSWWNLPFMVVSLAAMQFGNSRRDAFIVGLLMALSNSLGYAQGIWSRR